MKSQEVVRKYKKSLVAEDLVLVLELPGVLGILGNRFSAVWGVLVGLGALLGRSWGVLGSSWSLLGPSWAVLRLLGGS